MAAKRNAAVRDQIAYWDTGAPSYRWNEIAINECLKQNLGHNIAARNLTLIHVAIYDALVASWESKYTHNRPRPHAFDANLTTVLPTPHSPAYPSEHTVVAGAASAILAYVFPDNASFFMEQAEKATRSRLLVGVDYPSDVQAGLELGRNVAASAYALESITSYAVACWDAKYVYWAIRPFQRDPNFKPLFTTPNHPSYPAAHGCASSAPAAVLASLPA
jgi:hypothetical protein